MDVRASLKKRASRRDSAPVDKGINGTATIMEGGGTLGVFPVFSTPRNRVPFLSF
jgi:hypothetical protein